MREPIWGENRLERTNSASFVSVNPMGFEMRLSSAIKDRTIILND